MSDEMHINVVIADRPYRLKIKPEEEETVRKAARTINDRVKEYQQAFLSKDKQELLHQSNKVKRTLLPKA